MWENTDQNNSKYGHFSCSGRMKHEHCLSMYWLPVEDNRYITEKEEHRNEEVKRVNI